MQEVWHLVNFNQWQIADGWDLHFGQRLSILRARLRSATSYFVECAKTDKQMMPPKSVFTDLSWPEHHPTAYDFLLCPCGTAPCCGGGSLSISSTYCILACFKNSMYTNIKFTHYQNNIIHFNLLQLKSKPLAGSVHCWWTSSSEAI